MRTSALLACVAFFATQALAQQSQTSNSGSAKFSKGRVTHNYVQNGRKGMRIHHQVDVKGLKGEVMEVSCYFRYDDAKANPLVDQNGKYKTPSGKVAVTDFETIKFDSSTFKDFKLFIPHSELHLGPGKTKIKFRCQAFTHGNLLGTSGWQRVTYTAAAQGNREPVSTAVFSNARMEHNIFKNGKKGLRLLHKLVVKNMKDEQLEVTCHFFFKKSGKALKDFNRKYHTRNGNVSVADYVKVKYTDSTWKDFKHFIPYNELHITQKGKTKLKVRCEAFDHGKSIGVGPWQYLDFNK